MKRDYIVWNDGSVSIVYLGVRAENIRDLAALYQEAGEVYSYHQDGTRIVFNYKGNKNKREEVRLG
jgi:hypothetical protein